MGNMDKIGFEWDHKKDKKNREKHKVSFCEAQYAFLDLHRIIARDLKHSDKEERYFCIGKIGENILTVSFTYREKTIRIISAGYWGTGRRIYEEKN